MLAFLCTGPNPSFDPLCDSNDLALMALPALALAVLAALRFAGYASELRGWRWPVAAVVFVIAFIGSAVVVAGIADAVMN